MVRIECLDGVREDDAEPVAADALATDALGAGALGAGAVAADALAADELDPPSLLVRVQVGLGSGERRVLGPAAATPAQADAMVLTAMGGIYQALAASCEDESHQPPTSRHLPGEP